MRISDWSSDVCSSDLGLAAKAGHRLVVLVVDLADDLLQDVFERHHALERTVLVDHQREMLAPPTELLELAQAVGRFRHEPWCAGHRGTVHLVDMAVEIGRASCRERGCQYV